MIRCISVGLPNGGKVTSMRILLMEDDAHFFAKLSINDFEKVKIAAIHPDFL